MYTYTRSFFSSKRERRKIFVCICGVVKLTNDGSKYENRTKHTMVFWINCLGEVWNFMLKWCVCMCLCVGIRSDRYIYIYIFFALLFSPLRKRYWSQTMRSIASQPASWLYNTLKPTHSHPFTSIYIYKFTVVICVTRGRKMQR